MRAHILPSLLDIDVGDLLLSHSIAIILPKWPNARMPSRSTSGPFLYTTHACMALDPRSFTRSSDWRTKHI